MNYQEVKKGEYDYIQVGDWSSSEQKGKGVHHGITGFRIYEPIQWPRQPDLVIESNYTGSFKVPNRHTSMPESVCSKPCPKGQAKVSHTSCVYSF